MAGGKETPRQKMIGMMYLVLTALLALNVSKEIINAFVKLDQKLMENNALLINQGDLIMQEFDAAMVLKENREIVKPYYDKAEKVRSMVFEIDKFINMDCKNELIKEVEGVDWVSFDEKTKRFKVINPMNIQTKDDYDVATRLFGGEEGTEGYERGAEIRNRIHKFRDELISYITNHNYGGKSYKFHPERIDASDSTTLVKSLEEELKANVFPADRDNVKSIYKLLTLPAKLKDFEEEVDWQVGMFDHAPVVAASALFTSLSNDIRQSEVKALEILKSRIKVEIIPINKIEPMAYAQTNYINIGDSLSLRVNIAAYDTTNVNPIRYKESDDENAPWIEWTGDINLKGKKAGKHQIKGQIGVKERGELKWKDWIFNYEVGQPTAVISNADLNVVYAGLDNKIEATASGYAPENISVTGFNGIRKQGDYYLVKPPLSMANQTLTINVSVKEQNGKSKNLGQKQFKVRRLPTPNTFVGSASNLSTNITVVDIMRTKKITAAYDASVPITASFTVNGFKMTLVKDGNPITLSSNSNNLTPQMITYLSNLKRGTNISFTDIRITGPGGMNMIGPPITFNSK